MTTTTRWRRTKTLFDEASRLSGIARDRYLDSSCGSDAGLRIEVESLLDHHESGTILTSPIRSLLIKTVEIRSGDESNVAQTL